MASLEKSRNKLKSNVINPSGLFTLGCDGRRHADPRLAFA
jgi:hypothetical protein